MPQSFTKDPNEALDYKIDWSAWLAGDTIATSTWVIPAGLTAGTTSFTTTSATTWVSGGTMGTTYTLDNKITTGGGRSAERSITIYTQEL